MGSDPFEDGPAPVGRSTWRDQVRERDPSGVIVRTGKKKPVHSEGPSRQAEDVTGDMPEPLYVEYGDYRHYSQTPLHHHLLRSHLILSLGRSC